MSNLPVVFAIDWVQLYFAMKSIANIAGIVLTCGILLMFGIMKLREGK